MKRALLAAVLACGAPWLTGCPKSPDAAQAQTADADLLVQAQSDKLAGRTDDAMRDARGALAKDPRRLDAWRLLVQLYAETGRLSEITTELAGKVAASPNDDALHYALGLAQFAASKTAGTSALAEFSRAAELKPGEPEYPFRLGVALLELERFDDATAALKKAVALNPKQAKYRVPLGLALARQGKRAEALTEFRALLELSPTAKDVKLAQQALDRLDDPLREIPKAEEDNVKKGIDWLQQADAPQQAIDAFQDVLDRYPDLEPVHTLIGLAYERLDDVGPAVEHLRRAIELKPDDAQPYLYLGELYYSKQKPDPAAQNFEKALERNPLAEKAYARLGELAVRRGDAPAALANFRALVALAPDDGLSHKALAEGYELAGEYEKAEGELRGVVERDPKDLDGRLRLGFLQASMSKRATTAPERNRRAEQAKATFQKVLDQQPENVAASRALAELNGSAPKS